MAAQLVPPIVWPDRCQAGLPCKHYWTGRPEVAIGPPWARPVTVASPPGFSTRMALGGSSSWPRDGCADLRHPGRGRRVVPERWITPATILVETYWSACRRRCRRFHFHARDSCSLWAGRRNACCGCSALLFGGFRVLPYLRGDLFVLHGVHGRVRGTILARGFCFRRCSKPGIGSGFPWGCSRLPARSGCSCRHRCR